MLKPESMKKTVASYWLRLRYTWLGLLQLNRGGNRQFQLFSIGHRKWARKGPQRTKMRNTHHRVSCIIPRQIMSKFQTKMQGFHYKITNRYREQNRAISWLEQLTKTAPQAVRRSNLGNWELSTSGLFYTQDVSGSSLKTTWIPSSHAHGFTWPLDPVESLPIVCNRVWSPSYLVRATTNHLDPRILPSLEKVCLAIDFSVRNGEWRHRLNQSLPA